MDESVQQSIKIKEGRLSGSDEYGEFEGGEEVLNFVDGMGGLSRHQIVEAPSVLRTPEDFRLKDLHCPSVISSQFLSHPKLQSNWLLLLGVTLRRTASRICCLLSTGSQTRCLSGFPDASELCLRPICG